jgi:hypothetical protein
MLQCREWLPSYTSLQCVEHFGNRGKRRRTTVRIMKMQSASIIKGYGDSYGAVCGAVRVCGASVLVIMVWLTVRI